VGCDRKNLVFEASRTRVEGSTVQAKCLRLGIVRFKEFGVIGGVA